MIHSCIRPGLAKPYMLSYGFLHLFICVFEVLCYHCELMLIDLISMKAFNTF
ncbi:hypothetical protein SAMN05216194_106230 [Stutzerimonas kunmingensis]|nr:hypothetical protein SAMN05216194_106230 [Stutzerimonas kunmingensis]